MLQNHITVKNRHKKFIQTVCATEIVYGLKNDDGFATSSSVHFDDEDGEAIGLICFWAEKARAKSCMKEGWEKFQLTEIPLTDFIENWCIGMHNDELLIGTQFDQNMLGFEAEPLELLLDLITELKSIKKDLKFRKFNGIKDLETQVKDVMES